MSQDASAVEKVVTITEFRTATGLSKPTIYKMIREQQVPGYKIGARYVIPRPWFNAFLEGRWTPKPEEEPEAVESPEPHKPIDFLQRRQSA